MGSAGGDELVEVATLSRVALQETVVTFQQRQRDASHYREQIGRVAFAGSAV